MTASGPGSFNASSRYVANRKHTESTDFKDMASRNYQYSAQKPSLNSKYDLKQKRTAEQFADFSKKDPIYKSYARNYTNEPAPQYSHERKQTNPALEGYYPGKYAQESARKEALDRDEAIDRKTPFRSANSPTTSYTSPKSYLSSNYEDSKTTTNQDLKELYKKIERLDSTLTTLENKNRTNAPKEDLTDHRLTIGSGASFNYVQSRDTREDSAMFYNSSIMKTEGSADGAPERLQAHRFEFKGKNEVGISQDLTGYNYSRPSTSYKPGSYFESNQRERDRLYGKTGQPSRDVADPKEERDPRLSEKEKDPDYDQILRRRGTTPLKSLVGSAL
jgi:hypothetical protein